MSDLDDTTADIIVGPDLRFQFDGPGFGFHPDTLPVSNAQMFGICCPYFHHWFFHPAESGNIAKSRVIIKRVTGTGNQQQRISEIRFSSASGRQIGRQGRMSQFSQVG